MRNAMTRENMMNSCRRAMSMVAGADNRTVAEVMEMSMRSNGANESLRDNVTDSLLQERSVASEDFSY